MNSQQHSGTVSVPQSCRLDWDSSFFGYDVYKIEGFTNNDFKIDELFKNLKTKGAKLIYWFTKQPINFQSHHRALLADIKVDYSRTSSPGIVDNQITSYSGAEPLVQLLNLAIASGEYSRFKTDPRFKYTEFERLYHEWVINSISKEMADDVLIFQGDTKVEGFVTYTFIAEKKMSRIGLIAVDESSRGKSIGKKLVDAVLFKTSAKGFNCVNVFTQKANSSACLFYEKCGFRVAEETFIYHIWLNNN